VAFGRVPLPADVIAALTQYWKRDCHTVDAIVGNLRVGGRENARRGNGDARERNYRVDVVISLISLELFVLRQRVRL